MDGQTVEIGEFLEELREFCSWLKAKTRQAEKDYQEAGEIRDKRKEIFTKTDESVTESSTFSSKKKRGI